MKLYRVKIVTDTSSFGHPTYHVRYKPSLPIPPVSTVLGLFGAVLGSPVGIGDFSFGYVFKSKASVFDLEVIQ
jgi:CRISPR-associated protein Cas5t